MSAPIFCKRVTVEEFEEQKKKATEEGMKTLRDTMLKPSSVVLTEEEFCSDGDASEDNRARKRKRKSDKFETVNHYLKLDLLNARTDLNDANDKISHLIKYEDVLEKFNTLCHKVDDELNRFKENMPDVKNADALILHCTAFKIRFQKLEKDLDDMNLVFLPSFVYIALLAYIEKIKTDCKNELEKHTRKYAIEMGHRQIMFAVYVSIFIMSLYIMIMSLLEPSTAKPT